VTEVNSEKTKKQGEILFLISTDIVKASVLKEHIDNILAIRRFSIRPEVEPLFNPKGGDQ
jgi:hypothetical protein